MNTHPARCAGCQGSGQKPGPPIIETVNGKPHRYDTVAPCDHPWWHDDTGWDPYYDEPLAADHPRAQAAFAQGYAQGLADIADLQHPQPPARRTP